MEDDEGEDAAATAAAAAVRGKTGLRQIFFTRNKMTHKGRTVIPVSLDSRAATADKVLIIKWNVTPRPVSRLTLL